MKNIKEWTIFRNGDIHLLLIIIVLTLLILRYESAGVNGVYYQWLAFVLVLVTAISLGSYTHRKVFPYLRPDKYLPEGAADMDFIENSKNFDKAFKCAILRVVWVAMFVLVGAWMLGNSGVS